MEPRIAICVAGQIRSAACRFEDTSKHPRATAVDSLREMLLVPLNATAGVDVFASLGTPPRGKEQRLPGALVSTLQRVLHVLQPVQAALIDEVRRARSTPPSPTPG